MVSTGSAQDDLQIGDVLTDPVGDGKNYTWDGQAWRSSGTVIIAGDKTAGVSANGQQITVYDSQHSAFMNSTFISVGVNLSSVGFRAHKNGVDQAGLVNQVWTKLTFNTEDYDRGNTYDAANSRWTPPAGVVHFDAVISITGGQTAGNYVNIAVYKNGGLVKAALHIASITAEGYQISVDDVAGGTDYYELYILPYTTTSLTVSGVSYYTYFSGHSVGGQGPQGIQGIQGPISPTWALLPTGFRANKNNVDQTGIPTGTHTRLTFGFEDYDQGGYYDPVLSRWTPPAGMVNISGMVFVQGNLQGTHLYATVWKNGGPYKQAGIYAVTVGGSLISTDDVANGSDYYELGVYMVTASGTGTVSGITVNTYFAGHMIGGPQGVPGPQGLPGVVDGLVSRVAFSAYKNIDQTGIISETWTKVLFQATDFNDASRYNTGTSRWTPPAGRIQISSTIFFQSSNLYLGTPLFIGIYKNGSIFKWAPNACVATSYAGANITIIDNCNGTDYYEIWTWLQTPGTTSMTGGASHMTYFMGTQL